MGIVHCQVSLPEECASKFVFNKKKYVHPFFLVPEPCHTHSFGSCKVEFMFFRRKATGKKKHAGQVSKQKKEGMRGLFLVAKAKWSLAWTGFCPSTAAIRDIPQSVFICKGLHSPT